MVSRAGPLKLARTEAHTSAGRWPPAARRARAQAAPPAARQTTRRSYSLRRRQGRWPCAGSRACTGRPGPARTYRSFQPP
eukprot:scaffold6067_cov112-Isochrysis_galbana.AAC.14